MVNPVTDPVVVTVYLNVIRPLVKILGLCSCMLVVRLSHWVVFPGIGKILGVGLIVMTIIFTGPEEQVFGLIGTTV